MGEPDPVTSPHRPTSNDTDSWRAYWRAIHQPWRVEPEIDAERQAFLVERVAIIPESEQDIPPFKDILLSRADIEWLEARHLDAQVAHRVTNEKAQPYTELDLRGANLRGAHLERIRLFAAHLDGAILEGAHLEGANLSRAHIEKANLRSAYLEQAHLQGAFLIGANLENAGLERVLASETHFEGATLRNGRLTEANLESAYLEGANLSSAHLERARLTNAHLERARLRGTHMDGAILREAHLEAADLRGAFLKAADFTNAYLEASNCTKARLDAAVLKGARLEAADLFGVSLQSARLRGAYLAGANLWQAHLEGGDLRDAHMEGVRPAADVVRRVRKWFVDFPSELRPADLGLAFLDQASNLEGAVLGSKAFGYVSVADVHWGGVNLAVVDWAPAMRLGEEREARKRRAPSKTVKKPAQRLKEFQTAARANRQLAVALQNQGLTEESAHFAYRAQMLQREILRRQGNIGRWLFSVLLAVLAGYGFRMWRILAAYIAVITLFALIYHYLGLPAGSPVSWSDGFLISLTAFHGRVFAEQFKLGTIQAWVTAAEAVAGLVVEGVFIAMLAQRFFGK